jgi:myo-inositol 2-dehydrogenase/D-chiro-inositol 1-dehydrogenase
MHFFLERYEAAYRKELEAFVAGVTGEGPMRPDIWDGVAAQRLADAAVKSLSEGRPVSLVS